MNKAEEIYYDLEFAITFGDEKPGKISKQTAKKVAALIKESIELNNWNLLHKMGYTQEQYDKQDEKYKKMYDLLLTY